MSTIQLDVNYAREEHLGDIVGVFCGSPIRTLDKRAVDAMEARDIQRTVLQKLDGPNTAELLPGQEICSDNIIRRSTTAEARGEEFYSFVDPQGMQRVSLGVAKLKSGDGAVVWYRPDGVVGEGEYFLIAKEIA
jgi:hypothetical protein